MDVIQLYSHASSCTDSEKSDKFRRVLQSYAEEWGCLDEQLFLSPDKFATALGFGLVHQNIGGYSLFLVLLT